MNNMQPSFRFAQRKDTGLILAFIKALAEYEKMAGNVIATEELLEEWIFDKGKVRSRWKIGQPTGSAEIPLKKWQKLIVNGKRPSIDSAHPACYPRNIFST